jgi:hypothetical protein
MPPRGVRSGARSIPADLFEERERSGFGEGLLFFNGGPDLCSGARGEAGRRLRGLGEEDALACELFEFLFIAGERPGDLADVGIEIVDV